MLIVSSYSCVILSSFKFDKASCIAKMLLLTISSPFVAKAFLIESSSIDVASSTLSKLRINTSIILLILPFR